MINYWLGGDRGDRTTDRRGRTLDQEEKKEEELKQLNEKLKSPDFEFCPSSPFLTSSVLSSSLLISFPFSEPASTIDVPIG